MGTHNTATANTTANTTATATATQATATQATATPQELARAKLQALLASNGASCAVQLGKLQAGKAYSLRELARAVGYSIPTRANGKPNKAPLRRELARAVQAGKLVTGTQGGYQNSAGTISAGKAFYMLVD